MPPAETATPIAHPTQTGPLETHAQANTPDHTDTPINQAQATPLTTPSPEHPEHIESPAPDNAITPATPPEAPPAPSLGHIVEIKSGDSLWKVTAGELRDDDRFNDLNEAQKTWLLSTLTNRAIEHHGALDSGVDDVGNVALGTKVDLSTILKPDDVDNLIHKAHGLTDIQQAEALSDNHTIAEWLANNPHKPLTGAQIEDIARPTDAPEIPPPVPAPALGHTFEMPPNRITVPHDTAIPEPPKIDASSVDIPQASAPLPWETSHAIPHPPEIPHPSSNVEHILATPEAIKGSIKNWHVEDAASGTKLMHDIGDIGRLPVAERAEVLSVLAKKVGDKTLSMEYARHMNEVGANRQLKDYLVAYPEAQRLGFRNYHEYAGIKDITVGKWMGEMPQGNRLASALRHPFFWRNSRGAYIEELRNGIPRKVPLRIEHIQLAYGMEAISGPADMAKTIGEMLANNSEEIERQIPHIVEQVTTDLRQ